MFLKLALLLILIPLTELALLAAIGSRIGLGATLAVILVTGIVGAALARKQGIRTLRSFREATAQGRMPHGEIVEGLMILFAGALLLMPGFFTDAIGFAILIPPLRAVLRHRLLTSLTRRFATPGSNGAPAARPARAASPGEDTVIDVEVIDR